MANQGQVRVSPAQIEKHLGGIDYPASKQKLVQHAREQNAPEEVMQVLDRLPEQEYGSPADVAKGVGQAE